MDFFLNSQNYGQFKNVFLDHMAKRSRESADEWFAIDLFMNLPVWTLCLHFANAGRKQSINKQLSWKNTVSVK